MQEYIQDFKVVHLSSGSDMCGEYETNFRFELMLKNPIEIDVYGIKYSIDRIVYRSEWGDEEVMFFANESTEFHGFKIPKSMFLSIYRRILKEEKSGALKGWYFSESLREGYKELGSYGLAFVV
ncbi:MAG: hypothetical protein N2647_05535 [Thermodesulfovibrio sp.]|nr:hypothetical protein [Thermodesulfovibrio sp.]